MITKAFKQDNIQLYCADVIEGLRLIEKESIHAVITSPPYWKKRDYGFIGQWGMEDKYETYISNLMAFMKEVKRILRPDGTVWINLGDSFASRGGSISGHHGTWQSKTIHNSLRCRTDQFPEKSLCLIPERFIIQLLDSGWILRNRIIIQKDNPMPWPRNDRFLESHEYLYFIVKSKTYYFDKDSIPQKFKKKIGKDTDVWHIRSSRTSEDHFATFSEELITLPVLVGCPADGIVCDPFMGLGTTGQVALAHGRKFIGIDGNADYFEIAKQKIKDQIREKVFPFFLDFCCT